MKSDKDSYRDSVGEAMVPEKASQGDFEEKHFRKKNIQVLCAVKTRGKERRELAFVFGKIMALATFLKWPQKHISNGLEMEQKKKCQIAKAGQSFQSVCHAWEQLGRNYLGHLMDAEVCFFAL